MSKRLLRENDSRSECYLAKSQGLSLLPLQHKVWRLTQCLFGVASFWIRKNVSDFRHVFFTFRLSLTSLVAAVGHICRDLYSVRLCRVSGPPTLPYDSSHRLPITVRSSILLLLLPFDRALACFHRNVRVRGECCVTQGLLNHWGHHNLKQILALKDKDVITDSQCVILDLKPE